MSKSCSHFAQIHAVQPHTTEGCEECLALGGEWVHLRVCLVCGHVGCCDQSPGKHATAHFHSTHHPVIQSFEPGEDWGFCYADDLMVEPMPRGVGTRLRHD